MTATVTSDRWVRLLPAPFDGRWDAPDAAWLDAAMVDRSPDLLAVAFGYVAGAPELKVGSLRVAGDASYGPLAADGARSEGADFNDYLGVSWRYGTTLDAPESRELGSLDCSGYVRMVFGYRAGLPMVIGPNGTGLPRRSSDQLASAPGKVTIPNTGAQATALATLAPGDLVFFDASASDGTRIDHVGIYLGVDGGGRHRFLSSRGKADGPTIGDIGSTSILDGEGYWARAFRAARRL